LARDGSEGSGSPAYRFFLPRRVALALRLARSARSPYNCFIGSAYPLRIFNEIKHMNTFAPVVGDLHPTSKTLIKFLNQDASRAENRVISNHHWMTAGLATAIAATPAASLLMLSLPVSLGAVALGGVALPAMAVVAMGVVAASAITTMVAAAKASKSSKIGSYLSEFAAHLEDGHSPKSFDAKINDGAGFFQRLSNRRLAKEAQKTNPVLKSAIKNAL